MSKIDVKIIEEWIKDEIVKSNRRRQDSKD